MNSAIYSESKQFHKRNPNFLTLFVFPFFHRHHPHSVPTIAVDGTFGSGTEAAVKQFQSIFNLPANGIVDYPTWYKISQIYVGVSRIAELT